MNTPDRYTRLSKFVSVLLHPLVVPIYVMILLLFGPTIFSGYTLQLRGYLLLVVTLYATVIPILTVALLRATGRIADCRFDDRHERLWPLAVGTLCYLLCTLTVARIPSALLLRKFMLAAASCELMCLLVSRHWKISLHLTTQGAVAALLLIGGIGGVGHFLVPLAVTLLAAGILASARLYLGCHDGMQTAVGFGGGFLLTAVVILFL